MLKRTLSFVLVLTMLATCLFILPVSAEETAFTYQAGGKWAEREVMSGEDFLNSSLHSAYNKDTKTMTVTGYLNQPFANFSDLRLTDEADGVLEIAMDVTMKSDLRTIFPLEADGTTDKNTASAGFAIRFSTKIGNNLYGTDGTYGGLNIKYVKGSAEDNSDDSATYGFPWSGSERPTYAAGTTVPMKYVIEKKDGKIIANNYAKINDTWIQGSTTEKNGNRVERTADTIDGVGLISGNNGTRGTGTKMEWGLSNASVKELAPPTVRLSDLSAGSYANNATAAIDFVLPEGMTEATLTVGGVTVQDFAGAAAGGYTGILDIAKVGKIGTLPVVLSGTANGEAFSASTTINVSRPEFGSLDKSILSDPVVGGTYADKVLMDNATFLSGINFTTNYPDFNTYTAPSGTTTYGEYTLTDATDGASGIFTGQVTPENSTAVGTKIDVNYDVTVVGGTPYTDGKQYYGFALGAYFGNTEVRASGSGWEWLTTKTNSDGTQYLALNTKKICDHDGETTVSMKTRFEIVSETQVKATLLAKVGDGAWITGPSMTTTIANGDLDMKHIHIRSWMNQKKQDAYKCTTSYRLANCSVVEKSGVAAMTDLSANTYVGNESVPVSICLPADYETAVLTAGQTEIAVFKGVEAGGYTANLSIAGLGKTGRTPLTLSGTTTSGGTFSVATSVFVSAPAAGSLDQELFTEAVAGTKYADNLAMTSDQFLAADKFVDSSNRNLTYTRPTTAGGAATLLAKGNTGSYSGVTFAGAPRLNQSAADGKQVVELTMDVKVDDLSGIKARYGAYVLQFYPRVNGTAMSFSYPYEGLVFSYNGTNHTYGIGWSNKENNVYTAGTVIEYKLVCEIENGTLIATQYARQKGDTEWQTGPSLTKTDLVDPVINGYNIAVNTQSTTNLDLTKGITWTLSNAQVTEKAATYAAINDLSAGFYTQYDTVPVDFNLPTGYKDAMVLVDGTPAAVFDAVTGDNAGSWQSKLDLKKLGKVGTVKLGLQGSMIGGGTFSKTATVNVKAATAGADAVDYTRQTVAEDGALTSTIGVDVTPYNQYSASTNPNGPFLTQYAIEFAADVDFTQVIPKISFVAGRYTYTDGYTVENIQSKFNFPQKAFNLKLRFINNNFTSRDGQSNQMNVVAYVDGVCIGMATIAGYGSHPMGDSKGRLKLQFSKPANYVDETIDVKNLTINKYSLLTLTSAQVNGSAASVTMDRELETANVTLTKADGTAIAAAVALSEDKKTITLTAEDTLPADVQVVFGAGSKEANYQFTGYTGNSTATLTRLGEAVTVPFAISANNGAATVQASDLKVWKSGQNAVIKATVNAIEAGTPAKLVIAAYTGTELPKLVESQILDITATEAGLKDYAFNVQFDSGYDYFKVFLWDGFGGMNSLYDTQKTN